MAGAFGRHWKLSNKVRTNQKHGQKKRFKIDNHKGKNNPMYGREHSLKTKILFSNQRKGKQTGKEHPNWQGGITPFRKKIMNSEEYKLWRTAVFERDNYTCIWCGDNRGNNLNADHIKPFALFPELRFAIDNGRTLCEDCHKKTNTYGCKVWNKK